MSRKKKNREHDEATTKRLVMITVVIQLINALVNLIEQLLD